ncbi:hypothetical protein [Paraburkholderia sp. BCC1876]|uniref:hypothetical protein n=1 Tax=Paraburkholderia sp. BCC1876 TaxID=2676303 RepID=UPI0015921498|nr:hypothetical protein [Paraburkholderia sp. BCC1876]
MSAQIGLRLGSIKFAISITAAIRDTGLTHASGNSWRSEFRLKRIGKGYRIRGAFDAIGNTDRPDAVLPHSIQESSKVYHIEGFGRNVGYVVGARPNDVACVMHFLTVAMQNRSLAE